MDELDKLFYLTGIGADYLDYGGERRESPLRWRRHALRLVGCDPDNTEVVREAIDRLDVAPWRSWLADCQVVTADAPDAVMHCPPEMMGEAFHWQLNCEGGERRAGQFVPDDLPEVGDYLADDARYSARRLPLQDLPEGYHQLTLATGDTAVSASLIACPRYCRQLQGDARLWGVGCQLYTLRSARNWGIGDFGDLGELLELAAEAGADFVLLNPLHAPATDQESMASPYSPSDRRFLNPLAIDPAREAEWPQVAAEVLGEVELEQLQALRVSSLVDYPQVATLKYRAFVALHHAFLAAGDESGHRSLEVFQRAGGAALQAFARHESEHNPWVQGDVELAVFLQWRAAAQLAACQHRALELGMRIGLVRDLAVGALGSGAEVQSQPRLFLPGASIGAPPDPLAPQGQDWGLPVQHPLRMQEGDFAAFVTLLRQNMRDCGALRIDHVMALSRTWWSLPGLEPGAGLYVHYPRDALMGLLRLESQRAGCLVIGEDLGVVPESFRTCLRRDGILGNALLYFERHGDGRFRAPDEQRDDALLMVTNHDVPTLADWWSGGDLRRRHALGLLPSEEALGRALEEREDDRQHMLDWLTEEDLRPVGDCDSFDMALCGAIHRACARSRAPLMMLQLEDLQMLSEPVNIPGTWREYPNWRRKQAQTTARIFATPVVRELLASVTLERAR